MLVDLHELEHGALEAYAQRAVGSPVVPHAPTVALPRLRLPPIVPASSSEGGSSSGGGAARASAARELPTRSVSADMLDRTMGRAEGVAARGGESRKAKGSVR